MHPILQNYIDHQQGGQLLLPQAIWTIRCAVALLHQRQIRVSIYSLTTQDLCVVLCAQQTKCGTTQPQA